MKIGDKVKVVKFLVIDEMNGYESQYLNKTGEIIYPNAIIMGDDKYPLRVKFDDEVLNDLGCVFYNEEELELIN